MTINKRPARHEIEELLPPYAPETLKRRHAEQVEQVLRNQPSADLWLRALGQVHRRGSRVRLAVPRKRKHNKLVAL